MRQLVKHNPGQLALWVADEGAEQGIAPHPVAPAQRGVGWYAIDADFKILGFQALCLQPGFRFRKITPIAHTTSHRKAPGFEGERQFGRSHHVPNHGFAAHIGIALVAGVIGQFEFRDRKVADFLGQSQTCFQFLRCVNVCQPLVHRTGGLHQRNMAADRLPVVAHVRATGQADQQRQRSCNS